MMNPTALVLLGLGAMLIFFALGTGTIKATMKDRFSTEIPRIVDNSPARIAAFVLGVLLLTVGVLEALGQTGVSAHRDSSHVRNVKLATTAYAGPSTSGYRGLENIAAGDSVELVCSLYGEPEPESHNGLWYFTSKGWLNDHFLLTGLNTPIVDACTGGTDNPRAGNFRPNRPSGPYAIFTDEGQDLLVRAEPSESAKSVATVHSHQLVSLQCSVQRGPVIPAPRGLGATASNNQWDKIVQPPGWIPDSFVASYSPRSVAPTCS